MTPTRRPKEWLRGAAFGLLLYSLAFVIGRVVLAIPACAQAFDQSTALLVGLLVAWPGVLWLGGPAPSAASDTHTGEHAIEQ